MTGFGPHVVATHGATDPSALLVVLLHGRGADRRVAAGHDGLVPDLAGRRGPAGRPVVLVGFSGGAAFAGGLVLDDPPRYAGVAVLHGTLPFDAGLPVSDGRLDGLPVFVAQGEADHVIPRELLDRTWAYLRQDSGAITVAHREPGGHQLTTGAGQALSQWIAALTPPAR